MPVKPLKEFVNIGIVPTLLSGDSWDTNQVAMLPDAASHSWAEIERAFKQFSAATEKPDIILIPEVAVPPYRLPRLKSLAGALGCLVIAGLDFQETAGGIVNRAALLIPTRWPESKPSKTARVVMVGKTHPAEEEAKRYKALSPPVVFSPDPNLWLFEAEHLGRFGVCLCFDFMDVDRPPLYRGQIHHLFVLAYNKDVQSFSHIAESLCRTIYCNVVVCNTGWYGGSVAISPYYDHWRRPVYQVLGGELSVCQVIRIPALAIDKAIAAGDLKKNGKPFLKGLPPGSKPPKASLVISQKTIK